jgi:hypothetical protein
MELNISELGGALRKAVDAAEAMTNHFARCKVCYLCRWGSPENQAWCKTALRLYEERSTASAEARRLYDANFPDWPAYEPHPSDVQKELARNTEDGTLLDGPMQKPQRYIVVCPDGSEGTKRHRMSEERYRSAAEKMAAILDARIKADPPKKYTEEEKARWRKYDLRPADLDEEPCFGPHTVRLVTYETAVPAVASPKGPVDVKAG